MRIQHLIAKNYSRLKMLETSDKDIGLEMIFSFKLICRFHSQ